MLPDRGVIVSHCQQANLFYKINTELFLSIQIWKELHLMFQSAPSRQADSLEPFHAAKFAGMVLTQV